MVFLCNGLVREAKKFPKKGEFLRNMLFLWRREVQKFALKISYFTRAEEGGRID